MAAARQLLGEGSLPTAVVAGDDRCAIGLMHTFGRAALEFPRDISIVGFDDNHLSHLSHIDLTTVHQDAAGLAQAVTDRLENESRAPAEIVLDPKLVVRGTTGPPTR
jgi:DNA-binding LacI/PurR family transcriptional regulator